MLFLQNGLMICEEAIKILEKDELTVSGFFDVIWRL